MNTAKFRLTAAALLMLASVGATAQSKDIVVDPKGDVPYVIDQRNTVVKSGSDLCWRTGTWTPGAATDTDSWHDVAPNVTPDRQTTKGPSSTAPDRPPDRPRVARITRSDPVVVLNVRVVGRHGG